MAKDDQRRKKFWEEDEEEREQGGEGSPSVRPAGAALEPRIHEIKLLLEQTHQLYLQYLGGIEKRPPVEKRSRLDALVTELQRSLASNPSGAAVRFQVQQLVSQVQTMRELWERKLREREKG